MMKRLRKRRRRVRMRKFCRPVVVAMLTAALFAPSVPALADHDVPNPNASCAGTLSVWNNLHEDSPSRDEVNHFFKMVADELGIPLGAIHSFTARKAKDEC